MANSAHELAGDRCITLGRCIHRASEALTSHAEAFGRRHDLSTAHLSVLHALGLFGETRMKDLGTRVAVGAAGITRRAQQLEERGLVRRKRSSESEREVLIGLTKAGEAMFQQSFTNLHREHRQYFDERLTAEEQRQLQKLLDKL